ncbi:MAG: hypothetical protein P4L26_06420 [Terracidiphilus sp.]|nr:hypothetical protein [Terracidiphilus sp.]
MNYLPFVWTEKASLADELRRPVRRVSIGQHYPAAWGPDSLVLWHSDGTGLEIFSKMNYIAERLEIGVLRFETVAAQSVGEMSELLPASFDCEIEAFKLILDEEGTRAECGVALRASNGEDLVIVPSGGPCHLAILGAFASTPHVFEPECELER